MKYKDFKTMSNDDMKQIFGGDATGIICTIKLNTTLAKCYGLQTTWNCPLATANQCQSAADNLCLNGPTADCCDDVDCPGAS